MDASMITQRTAPLVHYLRAHRPDTPILLVSGTPYRKTWLTTGLGDGGKKPPAIVDAANGRAAAALAAEYKHALQAFKLLVEDENVEKVLDELRPFQMADGGNVEVVELDGPIVKVRLQGACGSCPSSTMTLKMGIERKMRESIPEVSEVVQVL